MRPNTATGLLFEHHTTSLVFNDPPLHTRVRKIIAGAFTPRSILDMEQPVTALVDGLLDAIEAKGSADLIADLAAAVPIEVIGNLLAVPREEREPLRAWSLAILGALEPTLTPEQQARGETSVEDFVAYLKTLVDRRRARPGDPERDVLTRLIQGEQDGERLSERELLHNIIFILNAGHETTTNLVGNGLYALLEWPEEKARLLRQPELIRTAVEEFLRFESPNQLGNRLTVAPVQVGRRGHPSGHLPDDRHRRGQPRSGRISRSRPARHRARAQPAPGLRVRPACVHRAQRGAAGRAHCHRPLPGAVSQLCAVRRPGARRPGKISRVPLDPGDAGR